MTEFNNNETVTISLERYEELKNNQKRASTHEYREPEIRALFDYMAAKNLVFFYKPYQSTVDVVTKEEAKIREEEKEINDTDWMLKIKV